MAFLMVGLVVAVAAAARSTWSPCGLSMLSTITPFGERARRHRYAVTAGWFLAGSIAGGATLGGAGAALAALVRLIAGSAGPGGAAGSAGPGGAAGRPASAAWMIAGAVLALASALVDAGAFGPVLPLIRRQVDDRWLARYRPWVYGVGFGWQIGVGFATYLMTAGVALVAVLGVLSGSTSVALGLGLIFGAARGATVFLTARAGSPAALRELHGRIDRLGPVVRRVAIGAQVGAALGLGLDAAMARPAGLAAGLAALGLALAGAVGSGVTCAVLPRGRSASPAATS